MKWHFLQLHDIMAPFVLLAFKLSLFVILLALFRKSDGKIMNVNIAWGMLLFVFYLIGRKSCLW